MKTNISLDDKEYDEYIISVADRLISFYFEIDSMSTFKSFDDVLGYFINTITRIYNYFLLL